jgi:D-glycero-D-manno-heptose 1,7-bisphosphate phosphatase
LANATLRQAAILVGGLGTRLGALTAATPKPLLPVGGRPFLAWLLRELSRFGVEEAVLLTGHLAGRVRDALDGIAASLPKPVRLVLSEEPFPAGTGGALWHARGLLDDRFLLCNGDSLLDTNLARLLAAWAVDGPENAHVVGRMLLRPVADAARFGVVETEGDRVVRFRERPEEPGAAVINAGVYALDRAVLDLVAERCSLERDVLPRLAAEGRLRCTVGDGYFVDIGVPESLAQAERELPRQLERRALFLDRDGVLNVDHGWVGTRDRWAWMPGALDAIRLATDRGWHVFVVTNQSGVARGHYGEADVAALHAWVAEQARAAGGTVDDLRYCPYHPEAAVPEYRRVSDWRKPAPGMILDLLRAWEVDPARAVLVGDQATDLAAGAAAGVAAHLFEGGDLGRFVAPLVA